MIKVPQVRSDKGLRGLEQFLPNNWEDMIRKDAIFRAAPAAYGDSQARGLIRAVAAGLWHSHSNTGSKLCLQSAPQLVATPAP